MAPVGFAHNASNALPLGTRLHELEVRSVLGVGGFGIVYRAWDHALEREVALKEYMPGALAGRGEGAQVVLRLPTESDTFAAGLRSFVNEARLLARFDHPALVKVHRFWEGNGTAYIVMPYYRGGTLRQVRDSLTTAPDEAACRRLIDPLLSALEQLHREDVFHRDIAPDNILLCDDGMPVLLDFGAARKVIANSKSLTTILKPNFAPLEQYGEDLALHQGPWTDLYALGATVYYLLVGRSPPPSAKRALDDELVPLSTRHLPGCSAAFLRAIDWTLGLRPHDRPQDVATLRAALDGGVVVARPREVPSGAASASGVAAMQSREASATQRAGGATTPAMGDARPGVGSGEPIPTTIVMRTQTPTAVAGSWVDTVATEWLWAAKYFALALFSVGLAAAIGSMELFEDTVLVRRQLNAAHVVRFMGYAGALFILCLGSLKATALLRQHGGKWAWAHRFVLPMSALVVVPLAYAALLPILRPFMGGALHAVFNWAFVLGTTAAAGWLAKLLYEHADSLINCARRGFGVKPRRGATGP